MEQRKRKHDEFAEDNIILSSVHESTVAQTAHATSSEVAKMNGSSAPKDSEQDLPDRSLASEATSDDPKWQTTLSKKARKKQKKLEKAAEAGLLGPSLSFQTKILNPLRIKDLQALVLYVLSDGVAPTWIALKNGKKIDQVVVVMVPGMDKEILSAFTAAISKDAQNQNGTHTKSSSTPMTSTNASEDGDVEKDDTEPATRPPSQALPSTPLAECIIPIKAPGDNKTGKIHSSLQSMLISPEPKANRGSFKGADNVFAPIRTPLFQFVHSADELLQADYPVHPALFTNQEDAELEKTRRGSAGQSAISGWVDAQVDSRITIAVQGATESNDLTKGMQVYALDCEMVLTTDDVYSLARISVVDWDGKTVLDRIVKPALPVKDYFTQFSGITEKHLEDVTTTLEDIQKDLLAICTPSTILLGHSLESDLNALKFSHPFIVDTAIIYPHPRGLPLRSSLKFLANKYLKREIQKGGENGHDSVEDALAVLDLVKLKCEKGPKWGTMDANGESMFFRLNGSGCKTAIVEHGTPEKGLGRLASVHVGCQRDAEVVDGVVRLMSAETPEGKVNFVWSRLREMEKARAWSPNMQRHSASAAGQNEGPANGYGDSELKKAFEGTVANLVRVYDSLSPMTLFMVISGPGDMREVNRLQEMQKQYRKEFKVKKWDELTVKWTDDEMQALRKETEKARKGWGLVCLK